ncbi:MAG: radical SAM protein [Candidatus Omnitrophica bacterium]|nr:radical SAM protein [Candidatus Omnitrophota bacterium]
MVKFKLIKVTQILNPTSINLGDYVINPYKGCQYGCLYCYVKQNKTVQNKEKGWGSYVEVKINAKEILEKELRIKKPQTVLLGSITECFQPIEEKYKITYNILKILNKYGVFYYILTRSPYIQKYIDLFSEGFCKKIYFTINNIPEELRTKLENKSPSYEERFKAIEKLKKANIEVIPYYSPILPFVSEVKDIFKRFHNIKHIEFEGLNFKVTNIKAIIDNISSLYPAIKALYERMLLDKQYYETYWQKVKELITKEARKNKKELRLYIYKFNAYFNNIYSK